MLSSINLFMPPPKLKNIVLNRVLFNSIIERLSLETMDESSVISHLNLLIINISNNINVDIANIFYLFIIIYLSNTKQLDNKKFEDTYYYTKYTSLIKRSIFIMFLIFYQKCRISNIKLQGLRPFLNPLL